MNGDLQAQNAVLTVMNRRTRYLGLNAPAKATATVESNNSVSPIMATISPT